MFWQLKNSASLKWCLKNIPIKRHHNPVGANFRVQFFRPNRFAELKQFKQKGVFQKCYVRFVTRALTDTDTNYMVHQHL